MPGFDRTGLRGEGPMPGGGFGRCTGYAAPGDPPYGRGMGRGWGRGRGGGWGRGWRGRNWAGGPGYPGWGPYAPMPYPPEPTPEQQVNQLRQQSEWLKGQLEAINRRIADIEGA